MERKELSSINGRKVVIDIVPDGINLCDAETGILIAMIDRNSIYDENGNYFDEDC